MTQDQRCEPREEQNVAVLVKTEAWDDIQSSALRI
jgi:hypothetical protein